MIKKDVFTIDYIKKIQTNSKRDPGLIERVIYAFGLLESLVIAETPFIFKGGTSLMLLLNRARRFSTDIDILVEPGTPIDDYIQRASKIFPFVKFEEQRRGKKNDIDKRHFKFFYESPVNKKDFHIILDVVLQRNPYSDVKTCKIESDLIDVEAPDTFVRLPSANCIIADKLTAFAPHTTGIPFEKEMEIIKQLYDIASLFDVVDDFSMVKQTYREIAELELGYRGFEKLSHEDALLDTIRATKCIISKGLSDKDDHHHYIRGINNIKNHIYSENYSENSAIFQACKVLYIAASILTNQERISKLRSSEIFASIDGKQLSYIKKLNEEANAYLVEGLRLIS